MSTEAQTNEVRLKVRDHECECRSFEYYDVDDVNDLVARCRTVLKRCEGGFLGVLDVVPGATIAQDILADVRRVIGEIDAQTALQRTGDGNG